MADDRDAFDAILAEEPQHIDRGFSGRQFGSFLSSGPARIFRQNLCGLYGAKQRAGHEAIGCLAEHLQSGSSVSRPDAAG